MRGTLLIVEAKGGSDALVTGLEERGVACLHARGPLKLRSLLDTGRVDLILWEESPGNAALTQDLRREWERFPHIPVIHLFPRSLPARQSPVSGQVVESLPAEARQTYLADFLVQVFDSLDGTRTAEPAPHTELAFRNVLQSLREHRLGVPSPGALAATGAEPAIPATSLKEAERTLLRTRDDAPTPPSRPRGLRRLFKRD